MDKRILKDLLRFFYSKFFGIGEESKGGHSLAWGGVGAIGGSLQEEGSLAGVFGEGGGAVEFGFRLVEAA